MFESLDDQMALDERKTTTASSRWVQYAGVFAATILVFGALYAGILLLE
jgi:hypothetical protein